MKTGPFDLSFAGDAPTRRAWAKLFYQLSEGDQSGLNDYERGRLDAFAQAAAMLDAPHGLQSGAKVKLVDWLALEGWKPAP